MYSEYRDFLRTLNGITKGIDQPATIFRLFKRSPNFLLLNIGKRCDVRPERKGKQNFGTLPLIPGEPLLERQGTQPWIKEHFKVQYWGYIHYIRLGWITSLGKTLPTYFQDYMNMWWFVYIGVILFHKAQLTLTSLHSLAFSMILLILGM